MGGRRKTGGVMPVGGNPQFSGGMAILWRGDLSPFGCAAVAKPANEVAGKEKRGGFAAHRG